ncbi:MAG: SPOR domain-containing protein, partial [Bacteroidetes bacterium]|nr:SPOR domain-containing protein [Bacteroidota bacterium]
GFRSSVLAGEANGLTVYRVAVGQFANAAEARGLRSRLPSDAPASTWVLNF